jgi:PAS domain S-box-containing protein
MTVPGYTFRDLVKIEKLQRLFESFSSATGYTVGLIDQITDEVLVQSGWREICTCFHRLCEASIVHCRASNRHLTQGLDQPGEIRIEHCANGLVDACTPVIIEGRHLANLCSGQVFFAPPESERFRGQALKYGYDLDAYLKAVAQVPVVEPETFEKHLRFLAHLATTVAEIGLAKLQLRQSEERYRTLFEESQDAIFMASLEGQFLEINPAGVKLFGYNSEAEVKAVDITHNLYKYPTDRGNYIDLIRRQGFVRNFEVTLKKKDGSESIVEVSSTAVKDGTGEIVGFRGIIRDITEKRMLEHQLAQIQKMESIGQLAGGIAHDFNNFLTVINGSAEIARLHLDQPEKLERDLEAILNAGARAEKLVSQLLAFSRKQLFKPKSLSINQAITEIEKMLCRLIPEDIRIEVILSDGLPEIKADVTQIEQIFVNLVVNARDALEVEKNDDFEKRIIIETRRSHLNVEYTRCHPGSRVGDYVCFSVSDNGIGMDAEVCQKIFEPFFTTKAKSRGTGLGLATVYGIVKQNNGLIYVYSEPGEGTSFRIYWPISTSEKEPDAEFQEAEETRFGRETILVVEDEKEVCDFVREALQSLGYTVYAADDGQRALELLENYSLPFELLITDLVMPGINGRDLALRAQKLRSDLKIVYTSGYADNYIVHNGIIEAGVNFLQKPYTLKDLGAMVRKVLDGEA